MMTAMMMMMAVVCVMKTMFDGVWYDDDGDDVCDADDDIVRW
jgi:hypothetical protein